MSRYLQMAKQYAKSIRYCYHYAGPLGYQQAEHHFRQLTSLIGWGDRSKNDKADAPLIAEILKTARALMDETAELGSSFLVSSRLSDTVRDDADGGAVQPHEVSHLAEPIILNANGTLNPLVGKESGTGWLNYLNNLLNTKPVVL